MSNKKSTHITNLSTFSVNNITTGQCASDMAALDDDCENGHIRRIHPWYPRRLRQILRTVLLQLLPAFKSHGFTCVIVKPLWNANGLVQFGPLG